MLIPQELQLSLENLGSLIILGDLNIISQTKGRISRFPGAGKAFLTEDYYSLRQWTVQSTVADCTVHCNGLYSPLPETVVIRRTDRHNRKDENAWSG